MKLLKKIKSILELRKYNLPKYLYDEWFAVVVHCSDRKLPPAFDKDGKFIDYNEGDIVPMKELANKLYAYYKIIKKKYTYGDWLYDSDAYKFDLIFNHIAELN